MRRKLFSAVSVVSLLLCLATVVLWGTSYFVQPAHIKRSINFDQRGRVCDDWQIVTALRNGVFYHLEVGDGFNFPARRLTAKTTRSIEWLPSTFSFDRTFLGFSSSVNGGASVTYDYRIQKSVPLWIISLCLFLVWAFARSRRSIDGSVCQKCWYDLTGNVSGVCPECGTAVAGKVGA